MFLRRVAGGVYTLKRTITPKTAAFTGAGHRLQAVHEETRGRVEATGPEATQRSARPRTRTPKKGVNIPFQGRGVSLNGSTDRVFKPRKAPKRQFTKKRSPRTPVFNPFTGPGQVVGRSGPVSSSGRKLRKPSPFDPTDASATPVRSITRLCANGLYEVVAFFSKDQMMGLRAGRVLNAFNRRSKK